MNSCGYLRDSQLVCLVAIRYNCLTVNAISAEVVKDSGKYPQHIFKQIGGKK